MLGPEPYSQPSRRRDKTYLGSICCVQMSGLLRLGTYLPGGACAKGKAKEADSSNIISILARDFDNFVCLF